MDVLHVPILRTNPAFADLELPAYATPGAAGMDLRAAVDTEQVIASGAVALIPTALAIALPPGYEAQIRSRSGLAARNGIFALNAPGTVDSDYRGEIRVILANFGKEDYIVQRGERIAQMVIARYSLVQWQAVSNLEESERGSGGFGSTGR